MAATETIQIPLGYAAPDFTLLDTVSGNDRSLQELKGEHATVVMFICNHCPYVKHVNSELVRLANDYTAKGVSFIAINANDVENYPEDSPENMKRTAAEKGYPFPYLYDETQDVAKAYFAACTPDLSVFDKDLKASIAASLTIRVPATTFRRAAKTSAVPSIICLRANPSARTKHRASAVI